MLDMNKVKDSNRLIEPIFKRVFTMKKLTITTTLTTEGTSIGKGSIKPLEFEVRNNQ